MKKDEIILEISNRIYSGYYWPREQLVEISLAEEMNVSRTVIRDVLKDLAVKGLVTVQPHKGAFVAERSYQEMRETLEIQAILESSAAYLAVPRLNPEQIKELHDLLEKSKKLNLHEIQSWANYNWRFHKVIITACGNKKLINLIRNNVQFVKYWFVSLSVPDEIYHRNSGHEEILHAIEKKDPFLVRDLMEKHIFYAVDSLLARIRDTSPNLIQKEKDSELRQIK